MQPLMCIGRVTQGAAPRTSWAPLAAVAGRPFITRLGPSVAAAVLELCGHEYLPAWTGVGAVCVVCVLFSDPVGPLLVELRLYIHTRSLLGRPLLGSGLVVCTAQVEPALPALRFLHLPCAATRVCLCVTVCLFLAREGPARPCVPQA